MLRSKIVSIVRFCARRSWSVIVVAAVLTLVTALYSARNFSINSDINGLFASSALRRERELAGSVFVERAASILAVVEAPTSEFASAASTLLADELAKQPTLFKSVNNTAETAFFIRNALLFLPTTEVGKVADQLVQIQPLLQVLITDPTVRGATQALTFATAGVQREILTLDALAPTLNTIATTIENVQAGRPATFSWRALLARGPSAQMERTRVIELEPVLNFGSLEPGAAASNAIRQAAANLDLASKYNARVRLTGPVPIQDEELATLKENAGLNAGLSLAFLVGILWLALRSWRIISAVLISIFAGLCITSALGLMMVGSLNPISIAFAVLFVGIGVDFGIQFNVRYRAERYDVNNLKVALAQAARHVGVPLTLAAATTAAGFMSFVPTEYRGLSELGQIAGVGMIIAFLVSITLMPALLGVFNPPGEKEPLGYRSLAPADRFLDRHRIVILIATAVVSLGGLPLLSFLQFDFNPMNLRSAKTESIATYLELRRDPAAGADAIDVVVPSLADARNHAERLSKLPEVERVMTLDTFIPADQEQKIAWIGEAAKAIEPLFDLPKRTPPTDVENVQALRRASDALIRVADSQTGNGAEAANRLAGLLSQLADADEALRKRAEMAFTTPLAIALDALRGSLMPQQVTTERMPPQFLRHWLQPDGRARVEVHPKGDQAEGLRGFARAVLAVEPQASGSPVSIHEKGDMIVRAFIEAGICALLSIALLLWIVLRRLRDVWLTLIPLVLAGVVTLEICALIGLKLNFANIIALPLLLGIGVAFKIYYIMAWRAGQTGLLQSPLTRAVIFSALTTGTAFGSLWFSSHPGMSSMGKLLALSLVCTLAAAVLFQPVLMGPPREVRAN
jgi:uncharacterized protein